MSNAEVAHCSAVIYNLITEKCRAVTFKVSTGPDIHERAREMVNSMLEENEQWTSLETPVGQPQDYCFVLKVEEIRKVRVRAWSLAEATEEMKRQVENGENAKWCYHQPGEVTILSSYKNEASNAD